MPAENGAPSKVIDGQAIAASVLCLFLASGTTLWTSSPSGILLNRVNVYVFYFFSAVREKLKAEVASVKAANESFAPHLAIIQVGDREDSSLYVRMKIQAAEQVSYGRVFLAIAGRH